MSSTWQSYIPLHVARDLVAHPAQSPIGREQRFDAVVLFADVSGFTAISEALGKSGRSGTEELTNILNSYFEPMITLLHSYGGIVGKFGGDAMTVLFPYDAETRAVVVHRAIQCALEMQARMVNYKAIQTSAGAYELAMKAGLAAGPVFCTTVGLPDVRLEYIIAGSALDLCADAEHHASKGEVVVHSALLEDTVGIVVGEVRGKFSLIMGVSTRVSFAVPPAGGELPADITQTVASFLHPTIAQRIRDGLTSFINEHRKVIVLFVRFENLDYDNDPDVGEKLQRYFASVIEVVQRYDGYLNKVDMGDKGSKYIVLFGTPIAHEDDVERALYCALDLQEIPDMSVHIGINIGFVFCGQVGSPLRQEYTVMGDAVNLSARLMQAARLNQILMSEAVFAAGEGFTWASLPSIQVKGKSSEIAIRHLKGLRSKRALRLQEPEYTLPMVGRRHELNVAREKFERVLRGRGQVLGVTAEAGMGKSRLGAEIIRLATEYGLIAYGGECVSHGTNASYLVWQNMLRGLFNLNPVWPVELQLDHLQFQLGEVNVNFIRRVSLLGLPLKLNIPENDLTQAMDAGLRKSSLEGLLVECIRYWASLGPMLLVLEDCHWLDPLSNDLLEAIGRNIIDVPVLVLIIYRPPETEPIQPSGRRLGHFTEIRLSEFTETETASLIELKLEQLFSTTEPVSKVLVERITERAQGNPFYVDEMINLIHDQGIDPTDVRALENIELPDSLHNLIISRIDQLGEGPKTTLKVASILGRLFRASWLWGIYPQLGAPERVKAQLEQLNRLEITPMDKPEPELEYLFKHIFTREVAYESLAVATRTMLHGQAGAYIERSYPGKLDQFLNVLAHHYGSSDNAEKQREYFYKAGVAAQNAYANEAAIEYYQKLLPLLPAAERTDVLLKLGDILQLIGDWSASKYHFEEALESAEQTNNIRACAQCQQAIGGLLTRRGAYPEALNWLEQARFNFENQKDKKGLDDTLREVGVIYWYQGDHEQALAFFEQSQNIAEELGNQKAAYRAIGNIGLIYKTKGDYQKALSYYHKAQKIAQDLGDRQGESIIIGNVGNIHLIQGDYLLAQESYARSLNLALEIGYRRRISIAVGNMGNIYWYSGDINAALSCRRANLQIALELGDRMNVAYVISLMAMVSTGLNKLNEAEELLTRAIALGRALDAPSDLSDFLLNQANLLLAQGKRETALKVLAEAIQLASATDNTRTQFEAEVASIRTRVALHLIDHSAAIKQLDGLLTAGHDHHADEEQEASIQYETWKLDPSQENRRRRAAELYAALYKQTPSLEFRERYHELTGKKLPDPPPLPPLPDIVTQKPVSLDALLAQIDALIQEAEADADVGDERHH